jgi:tRNA-dihydrouridine synthase A
MESPEKIGLNVRNTGTSLDWRVCIAPMMDYTDRHCRFLFRLLSPSALLYTEMVTTQALLRGDVERHLAYDPSEHPVALQLGGSDPRELAAAAQLGEHWGYDEINLNCGCPSDRVRDGRFGACLMADPARVRDCVQAMSEAVDVPVTVKCRIGVEPREDELEDYDFLARFVGTVQEAGCTRFIVHARNAVLGGLSPKQNREIPPLRYEVVERLSNAFPQCAFVLNGGIKDLSSVERALARFAGVMIGREACQNPYLLAQLHQLMHPASMLPERSDIVARYAQYVEERSAEGHRVQSMVRHLLGLYAGQPGARSWRRFLTERAPNHSADLSWLLDSLRIIAQAA